MSLSPGLRMRKLTLKRSSFRRENSSTHTGKPSASPLLGGPADGMGEKMSLFDTSILQHPRPRRLQGNTGCPPVAPYASCALGDRADTGSCATELGNLIEGYRLYAKAEGNSPNTIALTTTAVGILRDFLEQEGLSTDVTQITTWELRRFTLYLQQAKVFRDHPFTRPQERRLSGHTVNCYLRAIRAFCSWLTYEEIIQANPFSRLKIPNAPRKVTPTFSEEQIQALSGAIDTSTPAGFRDWAIILTLLDTGLRVSELADLGLENVNLDQRQLKVCGKGAKERIVPIGVKVQRAMWQYLQWYRPNPASPRFNSFFLTQDGRPMTRGRILTQIKRCGKRAGLVGVRCSPHTFRHTFAISYLRNGGDVFSLQRILGHSSLETVMVYVNLAQTDVQAAHRRYSPADNIDLKEKARHGKLARRRGGPRIKR